MGGWVNGIFSDFGKKGPNGGFFLGAVFAGPGLLKMVYVMCWLLCVFPLCVPSTHGGHSTVLSGNEDSSVEMDTSSSSSDPISEC